MDLPTLTSTNRGNEVVALHPRNGKVTLADTFNFLTNRLLQIEPYGQKGYRELRKAVRSRLAYAYTHNVFRKRTYGSNWLNAQVDAKELFTWACGKWPELEAVEGMRYYLAKYARSAKVGGLSMTAFGYVSSKTLEEAQRRIVECEMKLAEREKRIQALEREVARCRARKAHRSVVNRENAKIKPRTRW